MRQGDYRENKTWWVEHFQYGRYPDTWIPVNFSQGEILDAVRHAQGVYGNDLVIQQHIPEYVQDSHFQYKLNCSLGNRAAQKLYDLPDFQYGCSVTKQRFVVRVFANKYLKAESLVVPARLFRLKRIPDIFISVNADIDYSRLFSTVVWVVGWMQQSFFLRACKYNGSNYFLSSALCFPPKSVFHLDVDGVESVR